MQEKKGDNEDGLAVKMELDGTDADEASPIAAKAQQLSLKPKRDIPSGKSLTTANSRVGDDRNKAADSNDVEGGLSHAAAGSANPLTAANASTGEKRKRRKSLTAKPPAAKSPAESRVIVKELAMGNPSPRNPSARKVRLIRACTRLKDKAACGVAITSSNMHLCTECEKALESAEAPESAEAADSASDSAEDAEHTRNEDPDPQKTKRQQRRQIVRLAEAMGTAVDAVGGSVVIYVEPQGAALASRSGRGRPTQDLFFAKGLKAPAIPFFRDAAQFCSRLTEEGRGVEYVRPYVDCLLRKRAQLLALSSFDSPAAVPNDLGASSIALIPRPIRSRTAPVGESASRDPSLLHCGAVTDDPLRYLGQARSGNVCWAIALVKIFFQTSLLKELIDSFVFLLVNAKKANAMSSLNVTWALTVLCRRRSISNAAEFRSLARNLLSSLKFRDSDLDEQHDPLMVHSSALQAISRELMLAKTLYPDLASSLHIAMGKLDSSGFRQFSPGRKHSVRGAALF